MVGAVLSVPVETSSTKWETATSIDVLYLRIGERGVLGDFAVSRVGMGLDIIMGRGTDTELVWKPNMVEAQLSVQKEIHRSNRQIATRTDVPFLHTGKIGELGVTAAKGAGSDILMNPKGYSKE